MKGAAEQLTLFDPDTYCGKMYPASSPPASRLGMTSGPYWKKPDVSPYADYLCLDLRSDTGFLLERSWQIIPPWLGGFWTRNTGACPRIWKEIASNPVPRNGVGASFLSQILREGAPRKYYLTRQACLGILRRAEQRGKTLPGKLRAALNAQAGLGEVSDNLLPIAFAANQRDELRDLHDVSAAVCAQPGLKQQTYVAGFSAGAAPTAGSIGYQEEIAPTLKAGGSGTNMVPSVLCLNDQGGRWMDASIDMAGTLRADMKGHQPLVLTENDAGVYCIMGNAIDRQPHNGGNGIGYSGGGICYTVTSTDKHAVYQDIVGTPDYKGINNRYVDGDKCVVEDCLLIRRLMPVECELLQGFPPGWTDIPDASDTARYKAIGNAVAIPCVEFLMAGIVVSLTEEADQCTVIRTT